MVYLLWIFAAPPQPVCDATFFTRRNGGVHQLSDGCSFGGTLAPFTGQEPGGGPAERQ
ncbi:peptidyl-prolyl cis-trans isomerase D [Anopheles sinensis]|uniref:Peptidyl-prolyl cis-trans isomerase D n=1 Tax=Anopheles sinensis TaxID=74873 RepID=A0A084WE04_ANOSI|nr:peptidyl-prolyl cis-trans isomerase D [Anopheles sinensis]